MKKNNLLKQGLFALFNILFGNLSNEQIQIIQNDPKVNKLMKQTQKSIQQAKKAAQEALKNFTQ